MAQQHFIVIVCCVLRSDRCSGSCFDGHKTEQPVLHDADLTVLTNAKLLPIAKYASVCHSTNIDIAFRLVGKKMA